MSKKVIFTISFILFSLFGMAQKNINNYKYVLIPKSFDFTKGEDRYQLNSITKFLFNKYGFEAYFIGEDYPEDLNNDKCMALTAEVNEVKGGMFRTKLQIALKDCYGEVVRTSDIGDSKLKQFGRAYNEALRDAFNSVRAFNYTYMPTENNVVEVTQLEKTEVKETEEKETINTIESIETKPLEEKVISVKTKEKQPIVEKAVVKEVTEIAESDDLYYAQTISNGYQLVNSEPRIIMVLMNSGAKDVFIVKGKDAIVFKEDGFWYYSENSTATSTKTKLNIKF